MEVVEPRSFQRFTTCFAARSGMATESFTMDLTSSRIPLPLGCGARPRRPCELRVPEPHEGSELREARDRPLNPREEVDDVVHGVGRRQPPTPQRIETFEIR